MATYRDVRAAVEAGDRRASLQSIRDKLAASLDGITTEHQAGCQCECGPAAVDGRVVATVSKELRATLADLDALPKPNQGGAVVDLTARLAAKAAGL